ncbi:kinesin-like protein KIN-UA isoform X1 [Populus alba]|uniref:Kinesin-like protein n=2 Tax=Populus TaxID=3689 RepID=A0A4V6A824_POPAL|nr:kinesin-like protein KIN-UA [Populus alba]KAJ7003932.1 kinesin-like protein KIN-UA [Populus alba x Populus x berolinensis]TKS01116.1 armadillo/beta-catenin repeat family protein [Populus alba]
MATTAGVYRNGNYSRNSLSTNNNKVEKPLSVNSNPKNSLKSKSLPGSGLRKSAPPSLGAAKDDTGVPGRVRVAVRLRPRNEEEMVADADFADCVELQPEVKRLKLRKNNWDSDTYEFDEVLTEFASQKRVYEVVAKPVVESVMDGYNGTVMAYGQTGTGKTYTLGRLGEEDTAARGIMVRAMEDILADVSLETDSVSVSYLQLYMETIQDLLDSTNDNISIVEDPKSGDVSLPGASLVEIRNQQSFVELLRIGEAHRFAANTKLNTESSRSHAILMVHVKRSVKGRDSILSSENGNNSHMAKGLKPPIVRKGKLVVVDLAGSERIDKSGSEGHTLEEAKSINLSLSALGKCINALAENSAHIPIRDSKLTRLLRDSFGGTARTSLVITIGPSPRHRGETASTIMFGQRAMKVENMLKLKEEFDYKSLSRRLDIQLEKLIAEHEKQQKAFENEIERVATEAKHQILESERNHAVELEKERLNYQKEYMESIKKLEEKWMMNQQKHAGGENAAGLKDESSNWISNGEDSRVANMEELSEMKKKLQKETLLRKAAEEEVNKLKSQLAELKKSEASAKSDISKLQKMLEDEACQKEKLEGEITVLQSQLLQISFEADETARRIDNGGSENVPGSLDSLLSQARQPQTNDLGNGEKSSIAKLFEQVGLQRILSLLEVEDVDVRIHAVKVVANLAAEETNQKKIVEAGGLKSLLMLLRSSEDETIHRVAAGAIANLAMNETNQELIMSQGGIRLLSMTAGGAEDPQTLRMVAGAIANLCGNDKLQMKLRGEGGIKALLGMVRCRHPDVLAQVARGIANFAKCESRASTQGTKNGRSLLIEDGVLPWMVQNANNEASPIRRHIELALCHLAQHEVNAKDMISGGALWELVRISRDCSREDIRTLAHRTLTSSPTFQAEMRRLGIDYQ